MFTTRSQPTVLALGTALAIVMVIGLWLPQRPVMAGEREEKNPPAKSHADPSAGKIHHAFGELFVSKDTAVRAWVFFADKGFSDESKRRGAIDKLSETANPRAIARRKLRRTEPGLFDVRDLPVHPRYANTVKATGAIIRNESRWLNALSATMTESQLKRIARLPFVTAIEPVRSSTFIQPEEVGNDKSIAGAGGVGYGLSEAQISQMNLIALHEAGFTGAGIVIGILDTGFFRVHSAFNNPEHPLQIVAEWDFVKNDPNTFNEGIDAPSQHNHGTWILGTLASYLPGELMGGAYDASFILCKTEDVTQEVVAEEDNYVAGLEFIEANGGDIATSSLGYIDWYTQDDLDGLTAITTRAVNIAISNGLICCTAAGNSFHDADPTTSRLIAPADAFGVITCGAADSTGVIANFSSDGPTAALSPQDRRIKPELLARGVATQTVSVSNPAGFSSISGTSLSTPLIAGAVACLLQAHPTWTVSELRNYLFQTAGDFVANGEPDPLFVRGYGMINAYRAARAPCPSDITLDGTISVADLLVLLSGWGTCPTAPLTCPGDGDFDGTVNTSDLLDLLTNWGVCQ